MGEEAREEVELNLEKGRDREKEVLNLEGVLRDRRWGGEYEGRGLCRVAEEVTAEEGGGSPLREWGSLNSTGLSNLRPWGPQSTKGLPVVSPEERSKLDKCMVNSIANP